MRSLAAATLLSVLTTAVGCNFEKVDDLYNWTSQGGVVDDNGGCVAEVSYEDAGDVVLACDDAGACTCGFTDASDIAFTDTGLCDALETFHAQDTRDGRNEIANAVGAACDLDPV